MYRASFFRTACIVLFIACVSECSAQVRGTNTYGSPNGWGSVAFPGTGHPPGVNPNPRPLGTTAGAVNGRGRYGGGNRYGYGYGIGAYPVYVAPYDFYGFGNGYSQVPYDQPAPPPNVTVVNTPAPAPPVVINQYFGPQQAPPQQTEESGLQIYSQAPNGSAASANEPSDPRTFLIAYKDHSVYTALAYWIEDHTLHYVTTQNTHNQADLSLIDTEFTKKLNQDRGMSFSVTPAAVHN